MKLKFFPTSLGIAALLAVAPCLNASNLFLGPGANGLMPATAGPPTGTLIASLDSGDVRDLTGFLWTTELHSAVYAADPGNPYGGLTFRYMLDNVVHPATAGSSLNLLGIPWDAAPATVEVNQTVEPLGVNAWFAANSGTSLIFGWQPNLIQPSQSSQWLVVYTSLAAYEAGDAFVGGSGSAQVVTALTPTGPGGPGVPEPSSVATALVALCLGGLAKCRKFMA